MIVSDEGLKFIIGHEGVRYNWYQDVAGHWTIGVGHMNDSMVLPLGLRAPLSMDGVMQLLRYDTKWCGETIEAAFPNRVFKQSQFDALAAFVFNLGDIGAHSSTGTDLRNAINNNLAGQALKNVFLEYVYTGGQVIPWLKKMRTDEYELYYYGKYEYNSADEELGGTDPGTYNGMSADYLASVSAASSVLLNPSDDERKYGVSVFDTSQLLIRPGTAGGIQDSRSANEALTRYAKYMYHYLNSYLNIASLQTVSMPWIRPGFNIWLDPLLVDRIYYVTGVQHYGTAGGGVYTTLNLTFGRRRKKFQEGKLEFGGLQPNSSGDIFVSTMDVTPKDFSPHVLTTAYDFESLKERMSLKYSKAGTVQPMLKAHDDTYYNWLYGDSQSQVNASDEGTPEIHGVKIPAFDGTFMVGDIVEADGKAYATADGRAFSSKSPYSICHKTQGPITQIASSNLPTPVPYPYNFPPFGWMSKSSLTFVSRAGSTATTESVASGKAEEAAGEFDSINDIQYFLNQKYAGAPDVIQNRIAKHNKIMKAAEAYVELHYAKET